MPTKQDDIINRSELLQQAIATLQLQIQQIKASGEVAPPGCCVLRYQAHSPSGTYWYYKLHAEQPIFPTRLPDKLSKYKHLGKAGSPAHIDPTFRTLTVTHQQKADRVVQKN